MKDKIILFLIRLVKKHGKHHIDALYGEWESWKFMGFAYTTHIVAEVLYFYNWNIYSSI